MPFADGNGWGRPQKRKRASPIKNKGRGVPDTTRRAATARQGLTLSQEFCETSIYKTAKDTDRRSSQEDQDTDLRISQDENEACLSSSPFEDDEPCTLETFPSTTATPTTFPSTTSTSAAAETFPSTTATSLHTTRLFTSYSVSEEDSQDTTDTSNNFSEDTPPTLANLSYYTTRLGLELPQDSGRREQLKLLARVKRCADFLRVSITPFVL